MKILMITSEVSPFAKAGGLGDMVSALSIELSSRGHEVKVVCPFYSLIEQDSDWFMHENLLSVQLGAIEPEFCEVWERPWREGVSLYFLKNDAYFDVDVIYSHFKGYQKMGERFILLSRGGIELCNYLNWIPDVIHCHDWMTGFVPIYLKILLKDTPIGSVPTVLTLHNMYHQGIFEKHILQFAGLPQSLFVPEALELLGFVNMLKGGILYSTQLTTVSEEYLWEIIETNMGCGLNEFCAARKNDLTGILNGIDTVEWNPKKDPYLPKNFGIGDMDGKKECKRSLQEFFNLDINPDIPVFGAIARLFPQKGLDLLAEIIPQLMAEKSLQIVILGAGDPYLEERFRNLSVYYPHKMGVSIGYHLELAHLIEAGLDFFIMPSRFEPCGLNQMYSMIYGTVPIIRETGGLADTVVPYFPGRQDATGFVFKEISTNALYQSIEEAYNIFYNNQEDYQRLQINGMTKDFSWANSVEKYEKVYRRSIDQR